MRAPATRRGAGTTSTGSGSEGVGKGGPPRTEGLEARKGAGVDEAAGLQSERAIKDDLFMRHWVPKPPTLVIVQICTGQREAGCRSFWAHV